MDEGFLQMCCEICYSEYNNLESIPALFPQCGHSCCHNCLNYLANNFSDYCKLTKKIKVVCFKCKIKSTFQAEKYANNKKTRVLNCANKIVTNCRKTVKSDGSCNHQHLVKPKFICLDEGCNNRRKLICFYCRQTHHAKCRQNLIILAKEFEDVVSVESQKLDLDDWQTELNLNIDKQAKELADSLKQAANSIRNSLEKELAVSKSIPLDEYLKSSSSWDLLIKGPQQKLSLSRKATFDVKPILEELKKTFEFEIWLNLPLIAKIVLCQKIEALQKREKKIQILADFKFENKFVSVVEGACADDQANLKNYKAIIERHIILFNNELDLKSFAKKINDENAVSSAEIKKVTLESEKIFKTSKKLKKLSKFKVKFTNSDLLSLIWPNNQIVLRETQFQSLSAIYSELKLPAEEYEKALFYSLTKKQIDNIKKVIVSWPADVKQQFFAQIETRQCALLTRELKAKLTRLNNPLGKFVYSNYQILESEFSNSKLKKTVWDAFSQKLKTVAEKEVYEKVAELLFANSFVEFSFKEIKKLFEGPIFEDMKNLNKTNFGFRSDTSQLAKFMKKSEESFETFENHQEEFAKAKLDYENKNKERQTLVKKSSENKKNLVSLNSILI